MSAGSLAARMTSYAKATDTGKLVLIVACAATALVVTMLGFWESHQQQLMDRVISLQERQSVQIEMQGRQLAALEQMVLTNRRDLDRGR